MTDFDAPLEPPPDLDAEEANQWWREKTFDMATQMLYEEGPVRLLEHVVEVSGIARKARWRDSRKFRQRLLKNTGSNQQSRHRQPFGSVPDFASEYVKHALRLFNARAAGSNLELRELIARSLRDADQLDAQGQREVARETLSPLVEFHTTRLASQTWRIGHAMRSLLASLDPDSTDHDDEGRWFQAASVAAEEWQASLEHYEESYGLFMSMLPTMRPRHPDSVELFSRAIAWLTDGYGVRVAVEEVSAKTAAHDGRRAHVDTLVSAVRALMDEHFEFVDSG